MSNEILIHFVLQFMAQLCNVTLQKASIFIPYSSLITPWPWEHPWCTSIFGSTCPRFSHQNKKKGRPTMFHRWNFIGFPMAFPVECSMIFLWHFPMILPHPPVGWAKKSPRQPLTRRLPHRAVSVQAWRRLRGAMGFEQRGRHATDQGHWVRWEASKSERNDRNWSE